MEAIADGPRPDGLMVPMVPMVGAALEVSVVLEKLGATLPVLPLIETARGLDNAVEIGAVVGVAGLVFGGFDLALELGAGAGLRREDRDPSGADSGDSRGVHAVA